MANKQERKKWRAMRMYKGITLREVAAEIGSDYSVISKWERDERDISLEIVAKYKQYIESKEVDFGQ